VLYTPGHTDDSYSFLMPDRVFTGDTLLIRGTGRTDFQNGSAQAQYESLFGKLLKLPEDTLVYPAHDYKGDTVSTIGEERRNNPRLQVPSVDAYVELMNNLNLPNPKMMDVAVPANMHIGLHQEQVAAKGRQVGEERDAGHRGARLGHAFRRDSRLEGALGEDGVQPPAEGGDDDRQGGQDDGTSGRVAIGQALDSTGSRSRMRR